jgi:DNA invertase Pin-like site-specific DNA recombinase
MTACNLHTPLDPREVWWIAKSVAKWTWRRFNIEESDKRFRELQAERGRRSGKARAAASEDKRASARLMAAQGMSKRAIARDLGVPESTVRFWLEGAQ